MKENTKSNFDLTDKKEIGKIIFKLIFPIEFIISIFLIIFLYKSICITNYENRISYGYIIASIVTGAIIIALITINFIKNRDKIEKIFLSFIIPIGLMYLIFMMPTYVPDEYAHIWKSYQISEGIILTPIDDQGNSHTEVPKFFETNIIRNMNKYKDMNETIKQETDYNDKVEVETTAQNYPPILYTFSSIGLFISRIIGLNGILAQYFARICNFIVFLILSYYSIKIMPFGKLLMSCFLFIPMVLQQAASVSADSIVNAVSIFFIAFNMYLVFKKEKINKKEQIAYILLSIFIGIAKVVYIPLVGLSLLLIGSKNLDKKHKKIVITTSIVIGTIVAILWFAFSMKYKGNEEYLIENNVNSIEQIKNILKYSLHGIKVVLLTIGEQGESYLYMLMGNSLGWLEINIPLINLIGFIILIVLSIFFEKNENELNWKQRLWTSLMFLASVVLVLMALYISWTGVGEDQVKGIQGRYFIPIILLPLLCFSKRDNYVKIENINLIMMILLSFLDLCVISKVIMFFI